MNLESQNPVTGEQIWSGSVTPASAVKAVMQRAQQGLDSWRSTDLDTRIGLVREYASYLKDNREEIARLISREVGKLGWDAAGEVAASIAKSELSIQALQQRRSTERFDTPDQEIQRIIRYAPVGVALVLGPFNFPLHLPGGQIIPALLAGNTVVFKPSDQATAVGQWMIEAWRSVGLPEHALQWIVGGVETAVTAIDAAEVKAVYLTGSLQAGRAIHRQLAGRPEVLLALELGGNNPIVVSGEADPTKAANVITFSSFISAGQRCTCARRALLVEGDSTQQQYEAILDRTRALRVGLPDDAPSAHLGPLISQAAAEQIRSTYEQLLKLGCKPIIPWKTDPRSRCLVHPIIVEASNLDLAARRSLGELEWFGPLLVIERVPNLDTAFAAAAETPYGLSAALLGGELTDFERFVNQVGAGVVNWNGPTTGAAGALPFGGLGASGNHRPAGFHAIDFCCDPIASLQRQEMNEADPWKIAD